MRRLNWKPILISAFIFLCSLAGITPASAQSWSNGYAHRREITIDHIKIPNTDQTDFPVLISGTYSYLATTGNGGNVTSSNGYDIIFTSDAAGTNQLDHEIDSYGPAAGMVNFWVRIPTLSHTVDTVIYIFYGNPSVTSSQENKPGVWKNNYLSVYHLGNGTTVETTDSGSAGYDLSGSATAVTGKIGGGASFNGNAGTYLNHESVNAYPSGSSAVTLEAWVQVASTSSSDIFGYGANSANGSRIALGDSGTVGWMEFENMGVNASETFDSNWHHLVGVYNGGALTTGSGLVYVDGVLASSTVSGGTPSITTSELKIGGMPTVTFCCSLNGSVDEVRVSSGVRSADWIAAEYNNQNSPSTFYSVGFADLSNGYSYRNVITIDHAKVPNTDETSFPVLISGTYTNLATTGNGGLVQNSNGYDVVFTSDPEGLIKLDHEIDSYDPVTGTASFWVRVPTLSHTTDTVIYLFYGNSSVAVSQENKPGVWTNGYAGAWHFTNFADSLGLLNATSTGSVQLGAGKIGAAALFTGSGSSYLIFPNAMPVSPSSVMTQSVWVKLNTVPTGSRQDAEIAPAANSNQFGFSFQISGSSFAAGPAKAGVADQLTGGAPAVSAGTWHRLTLVLNSGSYSFYQDGALVGTQAYNGTTSGASANVGSNWGIGAVFYQGSPYFYLNAAVDDLNISTTARTPDWIATEYNNQNNPSLFYNMGATTAAPTLTSLSPTSGSTGTSVTITGTNFGSTQGSSTVAFAGVTATPTSWSNTQIVAPVPSGALTGNVVVTVSNLNSNVLTFADTSADILGASPASGPIGSLVTIIGVNFGSTQGSSTIAFNGIPASPTSWSDTQIQVAIPAGATSGYIVVTVPAGASNGFFCTVTVPTITSLSSSSGATGASVTINGSSFGTVQGASTVAFNGTAASVTSWSATSIAVTVPSGATTGNVIVFLSSVNSNGVSFTVLPTPNVSSLSTATGAVGASVTITGTNFGSSQGASTVTFNGTAATPTSWSATSIAVTVPSGATTGNVMVYASGVNSNGTSFTVVATPSITSLSATTGAVGAAVTITGTNFGSSQGSGTVQFNGTAASVTSWSATSIAVTVPSGATTGNVVVYADGVDTSGTSFTVVPAPSISTLTPSSAPIGGSITLAGTSFGSTQGSGQVQFGSIVATVGSWSDTSVTVTVPSGATTGPLTVAASGVTSNTAAFTLLESGSISSISPTTGLIGSSVTINGTGFGPSQSNSIVTFNTFTATSVSSWSDTQIVAVVPYGSSQGPVSVTVAGITAQGQTFTPTSKAQVTDSLGNSSSYLGAIAGGQWHPTNAQGSGCSSCTVRGTTQYQYDAFGNVTSMTDPAGHTTTSTYDSSNNLLSQSVQLNPTTTATTSYTYNSFAEVLTVTDPLGNVTTNAYDANGNLTSVTSPAPNGSTAASVTHFAYNSLGELTTITDPLGHVTTMTYTAAGLIATITDAQSNVTTYAYDAKGNRTSVTDALNHATTFAYDAMSRLTTITYPDSTTSTFAYDSRGRRTSVTDQNGKTTSYAYDDADRLTSVTDAASHVTYYAYDTESNLTSITDANSNQTAFTYDAFGRVTQTNFPSSLSENYQYDADNNLTQKTDRKGQTITYLYDALNRLTSKTYPDTTAVDYTYDLVGKIQQVNDPTGTYAFAYDNMGRLIGTTTSYSFLTSRNFTNAYTYDAASNRTGFTDPESGSTAYSYDTLNRLTSLAPPSAFGSGSFGFTYDALSRRTQMTRPNSVATNYSYDNLSRLTSVLHQLSGSTIDGASYTLDPAGNRTAKTDLLASSTSNYTYDAIYQLTQVTQANNTTESYTYDPVGNRTASLGVSSYTTNASNELTATSNGSYTYDSNGNTLTKTVGSDTTSYTWDFENRLTSVTLPGTGGTVTFKYDPFGRRIEKFSSATTSVFAYDGDNLIEEVNSSGGVIARYEQTQNIDEPLAMLRSSATSFYQADGLDSISSLTNSSGAAAQTYTYDSFGKVTASSGSLVNPFQYTGRELDSETGLYYYRARYYDPGAGRFLSEDPITFTGGIDFYAYVENNPTEFTDALGLQARPMPLPSPAPPADMAGFLFEIRFQEPTRHGPGWALRVYG
jgi:RHS repeat-associated protein